MDTTTNEVQNEAMEKLESLKSAIRECNPNVISALTNFSAYEGRTEEVDLKSTHDRFWQFATDLYSKS